VAQNAIPTVRAVTAPYRTAQIAPRRPLHVARAHRPPPGVLPSPSFPLSPLLPPETPDGRKRARRRRRRPARARPRVSRIPPLPAASLPRRPPKVRPPPRPVRPLRFVLRSRARRGRQSRRARGVVAGLLGAALDFLMPRWCFRCSGGVRGYGFGASPRDHGIVRLC
jgi:hypothetical protein